MDKVINTAGSYTSNHNGFTIQFVKYLVINTLSLSHSEQKAYLEECDNAVQALKKINESSCESIPMILSKAGKNTPMNSYMVFRVKEYTSINSRGYESITIEQLWEDAKNQLTLTLDAMKQHERDINLFANKYTKPFNPTFNPDKVETLGDLLDDSDVYHSAFVNPPNRLD